MISSERATHLDTDGPLSIGDIESSISNMDGISPQSHKEHKGNNLRWRIVEEHVCGHLRSVEDHLIGLGHKITFAGQAWSSNCRFWLYFDTFLDCEDLIRRFQLDPCVIVHANDDP